MKFKIITLFLFCSYYLAGGQSFEIHKLESAATASKSNKDKIKAFSDLGKALRYSNPTEAKARCEEAVYLSQLIDDKQYASYAWSAMCFACQNEKDAIIHNAVDSTLKYAEQSGLISIRGNAYYTAGYFKDDYEGSPKYLLKAIELLSDKKESDAFDLVGKDKKKLTIAHAYYLLAEKCRQYDDNLTNYEKYARMLYRFAQKEITGYDIECLSEYTIGKFLGYRFETEGNRKNLDSAVFHLSKAVETFEKYESAIGERYIGGLAAIQQAALLYYNYPNTPKNTILKLLDKAHEWASDIRDYETLDRYKRLRQEVQTQDHTIEQESPLQESSPQVIERVIIEQSPVSPDSIYRIIDSMRHAASIQEATAKEAVNGESQKTTIPFVIMIGIGVLFLLGIAFLYFRFRKRIPHTPLQTVNEHELLQQNELLQKEILVTSVQLQEKNKVLQEIVKLHPDKQLEKMIRENLQSDEYFEEYRTLIKEAHPQFYSSLQLQAEGKLTDLDLKYCTYIYMKIPSKQMANMLHVEYNTVRMTKYRLKQKLNLEKDNDLYEFIQQLA